MIRKIEEFNKYVAITGYRAVEIGNVEKFLDFLRRVVHPATVQVFDASLIADWQHLFFATLNSLNAFKKKTNISRSLHTEILLYVSAQHQIRKATEILGVKSGVSNIAVVIVAETKGQIEIALKQLSEFLSKPSDDEVLSIDENKFRRIREVFRISKAEFESRRGVDRRVEGLKNLVIERVAMLSTKK